ncbi:MAG: hypothetical protein NC485_08005 [Ruminococcus flavefaciens]|nr:hypothetical protein [Ruminococcus flavefaciens]MCM1061937.1 hypothetical protein [Eubacterium sp.]
MVASEIVYDYNSLYSSMFVDHEVSAYSVILSSIFDISQEEGERLISDGDTTTDELKRKKYYIITKKVMMISLHL